jgi:protein-S-isoprenylcysteine O-methyltransferase Ste14
MNAQSITNGFWGLLAAYWIYSRRNVKPKKQGEALESRLLRLTVVISGFVLLLQEGHWSGVLGLRLGIPYPEYLGPSMTALGVGFAIWARATLGRNWSVAVTLKETHELIRSGPYRLVRHPIYAGILLAALGTAVVNNQVRGLVGLVLICGAYLTKLSKEEELMSANFPQSYPEYKASTWKLVPYLF